MFEKKDLEKDIQILRDEFFFIYVLMNVILKKNREFDYENFQFKKIIVEYEIREEGIDEE